MKILHVVASLSSEHGGPPIFVSQLAIQQQKRGHNVAILTASEKGCFETSHLAAVTSLAAAGIRVISCRTSNQYRFGFQVLSELIRSIAYYDIIHVHSLYRFPVDFAIFYAAIKSKPFFLSPHGSLDPYLHSKSSFGRLGIALKKAYHLFFAIFISKACLHFTTVDEQKLCAMRASHHRSVVIPIGVPILDVPHGHIGTIRTKINARPNDLVVGHIGRFHHKKNLLNLIKSFHIAFEQNPCLFLVLIGPSGDESYLKMLHQEAKAGLGEHRIFFLGEIPHERIQDYLADIDIFCLPSFTENFGIALIEAMAASIPVIITKNVNVYELVARGRAGVLTETDVSSISQALIALATAPREARTNMGRNGQSIVSKFFSPEVICDKYLEAYHQLSASSYAIH